MIFLMKFMVMVVIYGYGCLLLDIKIGYCNFYSAAPPPPDLSTLTHFA